jgi:hypothetical protein
VIIALRLSNGDEIIGRLKVEDDDDLISVEQIELIDPMWIVSDEKGSIRLRDALVLYNNTTLCFFPEHVSITYRPSKNLERYYESAIQYSIEFTRGAIDAQIEESSIELEQWMQATREQLNASKLKLH